MTSHNATRVRQDVLRIKAWVEHWQDDAVCKLWPTEISLMLALAHAESALALLDRMEAEEKDHA